MKKRHKQGFQVLWSGEARDFLRRLSKRTIQKQILKDGEKLGTFYKKGKNLTGELEGYKGIHTAQDRYRIIFKVEEANRLVHIVLVGKRTPGKLQDVYEIAKKLIRAKLMD